MVVEQGLYLHQTARGNDDSFSHNWSSAIGSLFDKCPREHKHTHISIAIHSRAPIKLFVRCPIGHKCTHITVGIHPRVLFDKCPVGHKHTHISILLRPSLASEPYSRSSNILVQESTACSLAPWTKYSAHGTTIILVE